MKIKFKKNTIALVKDINNSKVTGTKTKAEVTELKQQHKLQN